MELPLVCQNIKALRHTLGHSQHSFGVLLGLNRNIINKYEMGQEPPSRIILKICQLFGLDVQLFLTKAVKNIGLQNMRALPAKGLEPWLAAQQQRFNAATASQKATMFEQMCFAFWAVVQPTKNFNG